MLEAAADSSLSGCLQNFSQPVTLQDLPYPKEMYAALAQTDPDYPGSCGRCYEVRGLTQHGPCSRDKRPGFAPGLQDRKIGVTLPAPWAEHGWRSARRYPGGLGHTQTLLDVRYMPRLSSFKELADSSELNDFHARMHHPLCNQAE